MIIFDKQEIRDSLSIDEVFELLQDWGGEPEYCPTGLIARTICQRLVNYIIMKTQDYLDVILVAMNQFLIFFSYV